MQNSVAVYIRLSREDGDREESDSVGNQRRLLTEYLESREELALYDFYVDDGYTGTNFDRPDFKRMLQDIGAGRVDCVVVKDLSRFGRDYIDTGRYLERIFPELGVRFIAVTDGIDSSRQVYDMLLPIKNVFNEQYARDISGKIQATMKAKQRAGEFIGAFASYGYRKDPGDKNRLVIDEYAAGVVRRIFSLYIQGWGKRHIAGVLNGEGILCPSGYKRMSGENYRNGNCPAANSCWTYSTIDHMLKNEIYLGNMVQGTKHQRMRGRQKGVARKDWIVVENTHEPVIDRDTWELAKRLLEKRNRETETENSLPRSNPFAGFVKCADCGSIMARNSWRRADGSRADFFYCGTYKRKGKEYCSSHAVPVPVLEEILLEDLRGIFRERDDLPALIAQAALYEKNRGKGRMRSRAEERMADAGKLKAGLERAVRLKKAAYEDYREGLVSREEYLAYREDCLKKEAFFSGQLAWLERKAAEREEIQVSGAGEASWLGRLKECGDVEELDRETVAEMVEQILVGEDKRIRIRYRFSRQQSSAQPASGTWR